MLTTFKAWLKKRSWHWYLALLIVLIATFVRLYNLSNNVMFLGDQGRDALIVSKIFKEKDPVFIGPVTSVGNMYLGPFYYYFMLPFLWLSYPSPMGPVYAVALLSVFAVGLLYWVGKKMFNPLIGLIASLTLALSATATTYSRFSWNPNLAPLFAIVMVYFNWKALKKPKYWIGVVACFAILIQLHYLTLLSGASAGVLWLIQLTRMLKKGESKTKTKSIQTTFKKIWPLLKPTLIGIAIFIVSLIPLLLFDLKHEQLNLKAFSGLLSSDQNFAQLESKNVFKKASDILRETEGRAMHILFEYNLGQNRQLNQILVALALITLALSWFSVKKQELKNSHLVVFVYLIIGILGTATYQHTIFNHYIAYLFPITSLVYAIVLNRIINSKFKKIGILLTTVFLSWFVFYNANNLPFEPNYLMRNAKQTAEVLVANLKEDEKYNIVLLSESKDHYGQAYRYFLQTTKQPPLAIGDYDQIETLIIIDEFKKPSQATNTDIYDLVVFPEKNIDQQVEVPSGPNLYYLRINSH